MVAAGSFVARGGRVLSPPSFNRNRHGAPRFGGRRMASRANRSTSIRWPVLSIRARRVATEFEGAHLCTGWYRHADTIDPRALRFYRSKRSGERLSNANWCEARFWISLVGRIRRRDWRSPAKRVSAVGYPTSRKRQQITRQSWTLVNRAWRFCEDLLTVINGHNASSDRSGRPGRNGHSGQARC